MFGRELFLRIFDDYLHWGSMLSLAERVYEIGDEKYESKEIDQRNEERDDSRRRRNQQDYSKLFLTRGKKMMVSQFNCEQNTT